MEMGRFIRSLTFHISTRFDLRYLKKPNRLINQMRRLDPAGNYKSSTAKWIAPLKVWRVELG